jgi:hypothetical protein
MSKDQPAVFVIAPENVPVHVRKTDVPVMRFATSEEFEKWRKGSAERVGAAVNAVLAELGIDPATCSPRTREILARLADREAVPSVKELLALCSSRRSFYRWWTRDIGEQPAAFLERVRVAQLGTPRDSDAVR